MKKHLQQVSESVIFSAFDDVILEVTADCGTITGIFELPETAENFAWKRAVEKIQVFGEEVWQP